jgi:hypothetical protein
MGRRSLPFLFLLLVCVGAFAQYRDTLAFGFNYDDYHLVRPYAASEVLAAFHGSWDATGIERSFYRPLTVAFYAARFDAFRYNAWKYHALSLTLFALAGAIGMVLLARLTGRWSAAVWFAVFWCVHPNLPISLVAWITNQMHLLQTIVCLSAIVWWTVIRNRSLIWWTPLLALQVVAMCIKEDGILLLPFVLAVHALYWIVVDRSATRVSPLALLIGGVFLATLLLWRRYALGGLGGYRVSWEQDTLIANLTKGPTRAVFLRPARAWPLLLQAWYVLVVMAAGLIVAWFKDRRAFATICIGLGMAFTFNLPFALVTKAEQYYLLATGAVIALAAAADALARTKGWWSQATMIAASVPVVLAMQSAASAAAHLYAPTSDATRATDAIVKEWAAVPQEIREWIGKKTVPPNTGDLARDLPSIMLGAYDTERDRTGRTYRWTTGHVIAFINADADSVKFSLQPLFIERPKRPFAVRVLVEGEPAASETLETDAEHPFVVMLPSRSRGGRSHSSDMKKLEIVIDHTWTPGPGDPRKLGVKLYDFSTTASRAGFIRIGAPPADRFVAHVGTGARLPRRR